MKIYFAHPISHYDTPHEAKCLKRIKEWAKEVFSGRKKIEILNPNQRVHQEAYQTKGFRHFDALVRSCDIIVAVSFHDGEWGAGVYRELQQQNIHDCYSLTNDMKISPLDYRDIRPLSIRETSHRVRTLKQL